MDLMPLHRRWSVRPELANAWAKLLTDQHGIVHVSQLREFGVSRGALQANLDALRWRRVVHGVYATYTGPLTNPARISAALLYGGPRAVLSHRSAAQEFGRLPADDGPVEITVPYRCSAIAQLPLVKVHRSRAMAHIVVPSVPPRTRMVDTLIDLAVAEPTGALATAKFIELAGQWPVTVPRLARNLRVRPTYRYRKHLDNALRMVADGIMSVLEQKYHQDVEVAHGIPSALRQAVVVVDDKKLYEDATYDHVGAPVTVRTDSRAWHSTAGVAFRDRRRDNVAELRNRSRLTYGWRDVHDDPCGVAAEVATVLRRYNVRFTQRICHRCKAQARAG
jgi:hypothetical protein